MIPILSSKQISKLDQLTIENRGIESKQLMKEAAGKCSIWILNRYKPQTPIHVFAGVGNNGGDGFVIANDLSEAGFKVLLTIIQFMDKPSTDFEFYYDRLKGTNICEVKWGRLDSIDQNALIIDAVFGNGLNRPADGVAQHYIDFVNSLTNDVLSIDMPSGLSSNSIDLGSVINATFTLTFQLPKFSQLVPKTGAYCGALHIIDIGLDLNAMNSMESNTYFIDHILDFKHHFIRGKFSHKGSYGKSLIASGRLGSMGAATLCANAAVAAGSGLVTTAIPACGIDIMQCACPEAMCQIIGKEHLSEGIKLHDGQTLAIGPGIGKHKDTVKALKETLEMLETPIVLDADALNIISENKSLLDEIPSDSILTPHPKEFTRLCGKAENDKHRSELLRAFAMKHHLFVLLKGAHSVVACPDGSLFFNSRGNPGMATGGSGDVLTGVICGLLAQSNDSKTSAICGMYIHGLAGDLAMQELDTHSLRASQIIDFIGQAMKISFKDI